MKKSILKVTSFILAVSMSSIPVLADVMSMDGMVSGENVEGLLVDTHRPRVAGETLLSRDMDDFKLQIIGGKAIFFLDIEGNQVNFSPTLYSATMGQNFENTVWGMDGGLSDGFRLTGFMLQDDTSPFSIVPQNRGVIGKTSANIALLNESNGEAYLFQFEIEGFSVNGIEAPPPNETLKHAELANLSATSIEIIEATSGSSSSNMGGDRKFVGGY